MVIIMCFLCMQVVFQLPVGFAMDDELLKVLASFYAMSKLGSKYSRPVFEKVLHLQCP